MVHGKSLNLCRLILRFEFLLPAWFENCLNSFFLLNIRISLHVNLGRWRWRRRRRRWWGNTIQHYYTQANNCCGSYGLTTNGLCRDEGRLLSLHTHHTTRNKITWPMGRPSSSCNVQHLQGRLHSSREIFCCLQWGWCQTSLSSHRRGSVGCEAPLFLGLWGSTRSST